MKSTFIPTAIPSFHSFVITEAATEDVLWKKVSLKISQNSQKNSCVGARNFVEKETPKQVFFCEFYEIFKNSFCLQNTSRSLFLQ